MENLQLDKIYNIDCLEGMKMIPDGSVDLVVTSPPYNNSVYVSNGEYKKRSPSTIRNGLPINKYIEGVNDSRDPKDYFLWQKSCIEEMLRVCRGVVFYNIQILTGNKQAVMKLLGCFSENVIDVMIWDKGSSEPAMNPCTLNSEFELIVIFGNGNCKARKLEQAAFNRGSLSNVIRIGKNTGKSIEGHRASFPVDLPQTIIHNFNGDVVLDPFIGSGTTAIACIKEKRHYIGFELSKEYYEKAVKRVKEFSCQTSLF